MTASVFSKLQRVEHRRKVNRLTLMYKTLHCQAAINIPPYVKHKTVMKTRNSHPMRFIPVQTSCDEYKLYSYRPRTIILMTGKVYQQISF